MVLPRGAVVLVFILFVTKELNNFSPTYSGGEYNKASIQVLITCIEALIYLYILFPKILNLSNK